MSELAEVRCQACGRPAATIEMSSREFVALCSSPCPGLIEAGILRREEVDGTVRYRQWEMRWVEGDLLPEVEQPLG